MVSLVDIHCHLLAGLDDGPRTAEEALQMCRAAYAEGTRLIAATAHQNPRYPAVTPERIRQATQALRAQLREQRLPLTVFPCAEVMVQPDLETAWDNGELLSVADRGQFLLLEMPHGLVLDVRDLVARLAEQGVRVILAHPERSPDLLHGGGEVADLIRAGCLVQISASSLTRPRSPHDLRALRLWVRRGMVHLIGSDGHSPDRRPPELKAAYWKLVEWVGEARADQICSTNGLAVLSGVVPKIPVPLLPRSSWFARILGERRT
jgi:protein-tyrosine phosphatase